MVPAMNSLPWYVAALGAALAWGLHYPLIEHALKRVSLVTVLLLTALPIALLALAMHRTVAADVRTLAAMDWTARAPILALALTSLIGSVLLFLAIGSRNATLASLLEITYPLFVAFFSWLVFRELQFDVRILAGALLIFAGAGLIILRHP
jgi:drug/metabolite transporter (DMT)-like permease